MADCATGGASNARHACRGHLQQGGQGDLHQRRVHAAAVEQVATVHHQVDLAAQGGLEGAPEVGQEVRAAPASLHQRMQRQVEAEVRVGHEQDAQGAPHEFGA
jgi:hypothetical protein